VEKEMKKLILLGLVALLVLGIAAYVYAAAGSTKIGANGPHDIPAKVTSNATDEACAYCHIPHNSGGTVVAALSNRTGTGSAFCTSCHDGTTGVSTNVSRQPLSGTLENGNISDANMIIDLTDHTIGGTGHVVDIAPTWSAGVLKSSASANNALTSGTGARSGASSPALDTINCASCHDVHNHASNTRPFLRIANTGSALCVACHDL